MQYGLGVAVLALLITPLGARAGDVAQPVPTNGTCSVPADPQWTAQEKFVWQRVCVGQSADFNNGQNYGGNLDPRRPEGLPDGRVLRSEFLETILLEDKYRRALTRLGVRIVGGRFTKTIDLSNARLEHDLWLYKSLLERGANLLGLRSTQAIVLSGSKVAGTLNMDGLYVDRSLFMRDEAEFGEVILLSAHVGGQINLRSSKVTGKLNMEALQVDHDLLMRDKAEFGEIVLRDAHVGGQLDLTGSKVTGMLDMNALHVDQSLFMREKAEFRAVNLTNAHVGGQLDLTGSKVTGTLDMDSLQADHSLLMGQKAEFGEIVLRDAHVGGQISLIGSKVTGTLNMNALHVDQSLFMREKAEFRAVNLINAHVGGQLDLTGSKVTGTLEMDSLQVDHSLLMGQEAEFGEIVLRDAHVGGQLNLTGSKVTGTLEMDTLQVDHNLLMGQKAEFGEIVLRDAHIGGQISPSGSKITGTLDMDTLQGGSDVFLGRDAEFAGPIELFFAKVGGNLELAGGSFQKDVNITGAQISGELRLGSSQHKPARWSGNSTLILRNAKADALQDLSDSWPDNLDLYGFTYRSLGGIFAAEKDAMIVRPVGWFEGRLGKQGSYAPAPYQQLATVLRNEGRPNDADEVLYAGKERERTQSPFLRHIWLTAIKWLIGYGYHLEWTLRWVAGFLTAGVVFLWLSGAGHKISRHYSMLYGIAYSFDMLLPIIRLREKHYQIDLHGWVRYYFYAHRIMGYVLASFLIAGISGLTK